jgi:hypothetical protein
MKQDFEEWLKDYYININPSVNKDNFEDAFDRWLSEAEAEDFIRYANLYGDELLNKQ